MIFSRATLFCIFIAFGDSLAQSSQPDLGVPLSWREFSTNSTQQDRVTVSQNAIDVLKSTLDAQTGEFRDVGFWPTANVLSAMANQDRISNTTNNKDLVLSTLKQVYENTTHFDKFGYVFNDDAMWWATASVYAYRAYNDSGVVDYAKDVWDHVSTFVITNAVHNSGTIPTKNFTVAGNCEGQSMEGGVFWKPAPGNTAVNSIATGLYATLSAFLAELPSSSSVKDNYTQAATGSMQWIQRLNLKNNIVLDTIDGATCQRSPDNWLFTYNSGKAIEGLAVLANVTGDSQWSNLMTNIVAASVKSKNWQGDDGVITEGANTDKDDDGVGFKSIFIRGLHEAYERSTNNDLRTLIHSYIDVQYNALLDLASTNVTTTGRTVTRYSNAWSKNFTTTGQQPTNWGQMTALDVLVSAIDTNANGKGTGGASSSSTGSSQSSNGIVRARNPFLDARRLLDSLFRLES